MTMMPGCESVGAGGAGPGLRPALGACANRLRGGDNSAGRRGENTQGRGEIGSGHGGISAWGHEGRSARVCADSELRGSKIGEIEHDKA